MNLTDAATNLRDYLVEQDFAGDDGDIPDHIWQPFCAALKQAESGGSAATNSAMVPLPHNETFIRKCNDLGVTDIGVATAIWLWLQHQ